MCTCSQNQATQPGSQLATQTVDVPRRHSSPLTARHFAAAARSPQGGCGDQQDGCASLARGHGRYPILPRTILLPGPAGWVLAAAAAAAF